ncbi:uncharacterized protein K460DRAFT_391576 [Cucurbitaria berberidis CBS 394.84]|uniref:Uncharacterized protein n=1 Tax=Cucurbitaria berberidis CBS 394.84 TaxID=1168544 RepID=A0A9P4GT51_9PLEO|nr:uncharacterized protein K460DRAFT_391576 [Cucurbitaria berberidis CBS 394.84]KAF1851265.1 hypothetical protein K460DRAFT_391576 [Cucurbitaria berberidis CBS 394.84]
MFTFQIVISYKSKSDEYLYTICHKLNFFSFIFDIAHGRHSFDTWFSPNNLSVPPCHYAPLRRRLPRRSTRLPRRWKVIEAFDRVREESNGPRPPYPDLDPPGNKEKTHVVSQDIGSMVAFAFAWRYSDYAASVIWGECSLPGTSCYEQTLESKARQMSSIPCSIKSRIYPKH